MATENASNKTRLVEKVRMVDLILAEMPVPHVGYALKRVGGISRASYYRLRQEFGDCPAKQVPESAPSEDSSSADAPKSTQMTA